MTRDWAFITRPNNWKICGITERSGSMRNTEKQSPATWRAETVLSYT